MAGGDRDVYGLTRSTEAEHRKFEPSIDAERITEIPSNNQMKVEWIGGNPIYCGFGAKGLSISASGWLLHKYTFDASGNATSRGICFNAWDDRALVTYE